MAYDSPKAAHIRIFDGDVDVSDHYLEFRWALCRILADRGVNDMLTQRDEAQAILDEHFRTHYKHVTAKLA